MPSRELSVEEALAIVPQLDPEGLLAATYCELDGYASPESVVQWYAQGLDVRQGCEVTAIHVESGRVTGVETTKGPIACGTVVCCAGAWSREVAALAGVDLPVEGREALDLVLARGRRPPRAAAADDRLLDLVLLPPRRARASSSAGRSRPSRRSRSTGSRRLPLLEELPVQTSWWGYYEMSPDHNALVGHAADPEGFFYATGFSGHGFQQAPAVGEHVAELVAGREPTLDLSAFDVGRFERGATRPEAFVV